MSLKNDKAEHTVFSLKRDLEKYQVSGDRYFLIHAVDQTSFNLNQNYYALSDYLEGFEEGLVEAKMVITQLWIDSVSYPTESRELRTLLGKLADTLETSFPALRFQN